MYKPKDLASESAAAYIWARGGGAVVGEPEDMHKIMAFVCVNLGCVVFNVGFRNGPEVKAPTGQQDMVDCVLHILDNASKFGVDPNKACMAGISGGGWIATGAMNLLVKAN